VAAGYGLYHRRKDEDPAAVLGALSLILWTLVLIVTVKYVNFAMRVGSDGEGGVIALMTLLGVKNHQRPIIIAVGLFGAALIYGHGAITPAISALSALEGMEQVAPALQTYVLPAATVIASQSTSPAFIQRPARRSSSAGRTA